MSNVVSPLAACAQEALAFRFAPWGPLVPHLSFCKGKERGKRKREVTEVQNLLPDALFCPYYQACPGRLQNRSAERFSGATPRC